MNVDVSVIPAAGHGTRMRPATRSVPKALLPVVDRPVIQWIVEEGVRAGVSEFVIVVSPGVEDLLFSHFEDMEGLDAVEDLDGVDITWIVQEEALGLGHAVLVARDAVGDRPFFCQLGDNMVVPGDDQLGYLRAASDGRSVMLLRELGDPELEKYGVIVPGERSGDRIEVLGAVEKPGVEAAPSRFGFVGRYLFTPEVFDQLEGAEPGYGGEIQLTDAIAALGEAGRCLGWIGDADLLDSGTPLGFLESATRLGLWHPKTRRAYRGFLDELVGDA
ncbi:MAG: sugar phosphate nucleotidyltransferase [Acidimicrobiia bacterium]|nr:sugar phosphate nucleotidyltransferase [Acidimicrobiia bacterium]